MQARPQSQEQRKVLGGWEVEENLVSHRYIRDAKSLTLGPLGRKTGAGTLAHASVPHRPHTGAYRHRHRLVYRPQADTHRQAGEGTMLSRL